MTDFPIEAIIDCLEQPKLKTFWCKFDGGEEKEICARNIQEVKSICRMRGWCVASIESE